MKFVIDPIQAHPPHALSPDEIRAFFRLVPKELLQPVHLVRFAATIEHTSMTRIAEFSAYSSRLVVTSRRVSAMRTMREILECLIRIPPEATERRYGGPREAEHAVQARIDALLAEIQPRMPRPPHWNRVALAYVKPPRHADSDPATSPASNQASAPTETSSAARAGSGPAPTAGSNHSPRLP